VERELSPGHVDASDRPAAEISLSAVDAAAADRPTANDSFGGLPLADVSPAGVNTSADISPAGANGSAGISPTGVNVSAPVDGCDPAAAEVVLSGGRLTAGVVRVGDTVRRPASAASAFTARFLAHLQAQGFDGAPRYLGRDEQGRDVLTFLPGEVIPRWRRRSDEQIAAAARLLRRMHDASRGLAAELGGGAVVCHHDPSQTNVVLRDGIPVAFFDFDFAAVGDPLEDLGYLAWSWCVSAKPERGPVAEQARQVRVLADAYGLAAGSRRRLTDALEARLVRNEDFWLRSPAGVSPARAAEMLEWTRQETAFVRAHRAVFVAALSGS
jgi:hypothetical protein